MQITKDEARRRLREIGLRVTAPRVAVLGILAEADGPLTEVSRLAREGLFDAILTESA